MTTDLADVAWRTFRATLVKNGGVDDARNPGVPDALAIVFRHL